MAIYADDIAAPGLMSEAMQARVKELAESFEQEAVIRNRVSKCKAMHCVPNKHPSIQVGATTEEDCRSMNWNFTCLGCARPWHKNHDLALHKGT